MRGTMATPTEWNRFDICEAHYLFACDWHAGQARAATPTPSSAVWTACGSGPLRSSRRGVCPRTAV